MHPRRRIVNAVTAILRDLPSASSPISEVGQRVFPNRPTALWDTELPAICLYGLTEKSSNVNQPKYYKRKLKLVVEILVQAAADSDSIADEIAYKVENILLHRRFLNDPTFDYGLTPYTGIPERDPANTSDDTELIGTEIVLASERTDIPIVSLRMVFEVDYNSTPDYEYAQNIFDKLDTQISGESGILSEDLSEDIYQGDES
jgi:hypothetical protein